MLTRELVRAKDKHSIDFGKWETGTLPRARFAYGKRKKQRFGPAYSWRVIRFECNSSVFKILILLNLDKSILHAILHQVIGNAEAYLCELAYDAKEPGWHCHADCTTPRPLLSVSRMAGWVRRIPKHASRHRRVAFIRNEHEALSKVQAFFRLNTHGDLL